MSSTRTDRCPRVPGVLGLLLTAWSLVACSPEFNWREVRLEGTRLSLALPCKPDKAEKVVPLGGKPTTLAMTGCRSDDVTYAVAVADIGDASRAAEVLAQWQALTLVNMRAPPVGSPAGDPRATTAVPTSIKAAQGSPVPQFKVLVHGWGRHADGQVVDGWAMYFAQGSQLFQVVMYNDRPRPGLAETFFGTLELR